MSAVAAAAAAAGVENAGELADTIENALASIGLVASGYIKENESYFAVLNEWETRDQIARAQRTYNHGRFSYPGTVHGRWYCCFKAAVMPDNLD